MALRSFYAAAFLAATTIGICAYGEEIDISPKGGSPTVILDKVHKHFLQQNPVNLLLKGVDGDVAAGTQILDRIAEKAIKLGPRGTINVETTSSQVANCFVKKIANGPYAKDIQIRTLLVSNSGAGCPTLLAHGVSPFSDYIRLNRLDADGYKNSLAANSVKMTTQADSRADTVWNYLASSSLEDSNSDSFRVLLLEGYIGSDATSFLWGLKRYLGNRLLGDLLGTGTFPLPISRSNPFSKFKKDELVIGAADLMIGPAFRTRPNQAVYGSMSNVSNQKLEPYLDLFQWALNNHSGDQPLLLIIDSFDNATPAFQTAFMTDLTRLLQSLGPAKRESVKLIISADPRAVRFSQAQMSGGPSLPLDMLKQATKASKASMTGTPIEFVPETVSF